MRTPREGAVATKSAPGGYDGENADGGGAFSAAEAKSGPNQEWEAKIFEWVVLDDEGKAIAENEPSGGEKSEEEKTKFDGLLAGPVKTGVLDPNQEEGRDDQGAHAIAKPPGDPDRSKTRTVGQSTEDKHSAANRGADRRADYAGEESEPENVLRSLKCLATFGEARNEVTAGDRFKSVAGGDAKRGEGGARSGEVDEEGSGKNSGPNAIAEEQESGKGDTGTWPDGRSTGIQKSELQTELSCNKIHRNEPQEEDWTSRLEFAIHGRSLATLGTG